MTAAAEIDRERVQARYMHATAGQVRGGKSKAGDPHRRWRVYRLDICQREVALSKLCPTEDAAWHNAAKRLAARREQRTKLWRA